MLRNLKGEPNWIYLRDHNRSVRPVKKLSKNPPKITQECYKKFTESRHSLKQSKTIFPSSLLHITLSTFVGNNAARLFYNSNHSVHRKNYTIFTHKTFGVCWILFFFLFVFFTIQNGEWVSEREIMCGEVIKVIYISCNNTLFPLWLYIFMYNTDPSVFYGIAHYFHDLKNVL
jgi:hypothetical protein